MFSTIPITIRLGSCPKNKFSWFAIMLCFGTEKTLVSTRHRGYLADILSIPRMWSNWTEGSTFTLRTKSATSSIFTLPSPMRLKASLLLTSRILMSICLFRSTSSDPGNTSRGEVCRSWRLACYPCSTLVDSWNLCSTGDPPYVWPCLYTTWQRSNKTP